jgi:hypothetical protein
MQLISLWYLPVRTNVVWGSLVVSFAMMMASVTRPSGPSVQNLLM